MKKRVQIIGKAGGGRCMEKLVAMGDEEENLLTNLCAVDFVLLKGCGKRRRK